MISVTVRLGCLWLNVLVIFMGLLILSMVELVYYQFELLLSSECGIFPLTHIASILQHQHTDSTDIEGGL